MSIMGKLSLAFKARANKILDQMEDPGETLDYSYQRQLDLLTKWVTPEVRRGSGCPW